VYAVFSEILGVGSDGGEDERGGMIVVMTHLGTTDGPAATGGDGANSVKSASRVSKHLHQRKANICESVDRDHCLLRAIEVRVVLCCFPEGSQRTAPRRAAPR